MDDYTIIIKKEYQAEVDQYEQQAASPAVWLLSK